MRKKNWMFQFVNFIKEERVRQNITQLDLAKAIKRKYSFISKLENCEYISVKVDLFLDVANTFKIDPIELMKKVGLM